MTKCVVVSESGRHKGAWLGDELYFEHTEYESPVSLHFCRDVQQGAEWMEGDLSGQVWAADKNGEVKGTEVAVGAMGVGETSQEECAEQEGKGDRMLGTSRGTRSMIREVAWI